MSNSLMATGSSQLEQRAAAACAVISDLNVPLRDLWNPWKCPVKFLPYLAWAFSVDRWEETWSEREKRQAVSDAFWIHQRKGTVAAVRRVIENLGYSMTLQEWWEVADPAGTFRLEIDLNDIGITETMIKELERIIGDARPVSATLPACHCQRGPPVRCIPARLRAAGRLSACIRRNTRRMRPPVMTAAGSIPGRSPIPKTSAGKTLTAMTVAPFTMAVAFTQENNMSAINEQTKWEDEVYLLAREDRVEGGIYGPSNKQARQLANRTRYLKTAVESLQDYRDYTFFMTPDDPDGTVAGLAGTPEGKLFRVVVPDSEGQLLAFIYYQKRNGQANRLNALASQQAITSLRQQLEQDTGEALDGLTALQSGLQSLTAALMQLGLDEMAAQVTSMAASQKSQSDQIQALMLAFQSGMRALALVEATPRRWKVIS
jgi:phage tail P2-like protein